MLRLFEDTSARADELALSFPKDADDRETLEPARRDGLPEAAGSLGDRCAAGCPATIRRCAASSPRTQFADLVPVLLDRLGRAENPDAALNAFDLFIAGMQRGARLFSLLQAKS